MLVIPYPELPVLVAVPAWDEQLMPEGGAYDPRAVVIALEQGPQNPEPALPVASG